MLMPKRVKRRRVHRGSMAGKAQKGNKVTYGEFGLVAMEASWITSNQIEAARIAMTRSIKRGGNSLLKSFNLFISSSLVKLFNSLACILFTTLYF